MDVPTTNDLPVPGNRLAPEASAAIERFDIRDIAQISDFKPPTPIRSKHRNKLDPFDRAIEYLLIGLIGFACFAFGGVQAWGEFCVLALVAAMSVCFLIKLIRHPSQSVTGSWTYLLIGLFLVWTIFELVPLPASLVGALSPATLRTRTQLLGDIPDSRSWLQSVTITFYKTATWHDLRLLLAASTLFVIVLNVYQHPGRVKRLLLAVTVIGTCAGLLGIAQLFGDNDSIYWLFPTPSLRPDGGPFVNHSHFAQFLNQSIGAAMALLMINWREMVGRKGSKSVRPLSVRQFPQQARLLWTLLLTILVMVVAIALSGARAGLLCVLVSGGVTAVAISLARGRRKSRGRSDALFAFSAMAVVGVLIYISIDSLSHRFAAPDKLDAGRSRILSDISRMWRAYPVTGTGMGTFRFVYPMFDTRNRNTLATHAENEYAQVLTEGGAVGLFIVLAFIATLFFAWRRCLRSHRSLHAAAFGLGYGLLAILIHSLSDFGQHMPANMCLTATFSALLVGLSRWNYGNDALASERTGATTPGTGSGAAALPGVAESRGRRTSREIDGWNGPRLPRFWAVGLAGLFACGMLLTLPSAGFSAWAERSTISAMDTATSLDSHKWIGTDDDFNALIADAADATAATPNDVLCRYGLDYYRWRAISRDHDEQTGQLVMTEEQIGYARRIQDDLVQVRLLCPTYGPTYSLQGQIQYFVFSNERTGTELVRQGSYLTRYDPSPASLLAKMEAQAGDWNHSLEDYRRAVSLEPESVGSGIDFYVQRVNRPDIALELSRGNDSALLQLSDLLRWNQRDPVIAYQARTAGLKLLKGRCDASEATGEDYARLALSLEEDGDFAGAADYFQRALVLDTSNVEWRAQVAYAFAACGRTDDALHEARLCLESHPRFGEMDLLIRRLQKSSPETMSDN